MENYDFENLTRKEPPIRTGHLQHRDLVIGKGNS